MFLRRSQAPVPLSAWQRHRYIGTSLMMRDKKPDEASAADKIKEQLPGGDDMQASAQQAASLLRSLLYGSESGRREVFEAQQSYSRMLRRGKYVHQLVKHRVKPGNHSEYIAEVSELYPKLANDPAHDMHLVGSWRTMVGDSDTFVHMWEYKGYAGYDQSARSVSADPGAQEAKKRIRRLLEQRSLSFLQEFAFWTTSPPHDHGGIFELRTYDLKPGHLLEWAEHWRDGIEHRRQVMEPVGAWFSQIGNLNRVHHLWQFRSLEDRDKSRSESWSIKGWSDTVHKTVPLVQRMENSILVPLDISPLR